MKETYIISEIDLITGEKIYYETYEDDNGLWWKKPLYVPSIFNKKNMEQLRRDRLHQLLDDVIDSGEQVGMLPTVDLVGGVWVMTKYTLKLTKEEKNFDNP